MRWRSMTPRTRPISPVALASPRNSFRSCAKLVTPSSSTSRMPAFTAATIYSAYVDDCVAKLKDQKFRAQFLVLLKKLVGLFDTLMPRPEARPFAADVKIYAFIAKAAANLYRDRSLDVRGVAHKVQAMLDAYIRAHGIDPTIPPIEILDPNFAAEVSRKKSDRAKAADMENALRHHISISFEKDPAKFKSLSERLEGILASHHEDWKEIARQLQSLIDEATAASSEVSVASRSRSAYRRSDLRHPSHAIRKRRQGHGACGACRRDRAAPPAGDRCRGLLGQLGRAGGSKTLDCPAAGQQQPIPISRAGFDLCRLHGGCAGKPRSLFGP